ncbi:hypothetical protein GSI_13721 [Ganoderma sinense ZZ0214-1]|uniref:Uncharacterized protein n=1 Tax=Ganoderma sinense ZZ0214-1 TaxID=1077348 RepID=A0A2G8RR29_9APHY|nr:hypothetical protein GSI_13721 [Ganoderma sinense ZZ0214-1]
MSYHDPYAHNQYAQQQYQDAPFNPYEVQQQHAHGGYTDGTGAQAYGGYDSRTKEETVRPASGGYDNDDVTLQPMGEKTPRNMRQWRKDYQGNLWTKGSRASCCGRFFCCTLMIFLLLLISVVLTIALYLRPPNVIVGSPTVDVNSFSINSSSVSIALPVDISVNNPNFFTVELYKLDAAVIYPINSTQVGSGHMTNIKFQDHTQTNFTFPVTIEYNAASDPNGAIITDLAKHCGIDPSVSASDISVTVNIKIGVKIMLVPFTTSLSQQASFKCPISSNDITEFENLLKSLGINLDSIAGLLSS